MNLALNSAFTNGSVHEVNTKHSICERISIIFTIKQILNEPSSSTGKRNRHELFSVQQVIEDLLDDAELDFNLDRDLDEDSSGRSSEDSVGDSSDEETHHVCLFVVTPPLPRDGGTA